MPTSDASSSASLICSPTRLDRPASSHPALAAAGRGGNGAGARGATARGRGDPQSAPPRYDIRRHGTSLDAGHDPGLQPTAAVDELARVGTGAPAGDGRDDEP